MQTLRLRREHSGLLLGVVLAGVLLGVWHAAGGLTGPARAGVAGHLRLYVAAGIAAPLAFASARSVAVAPADPGPPPAVAPARDPFSVLGPPTLSAPLIDTILGEYGSPAQGQGAVFYRLGLQFGIDPAFALGFYVHESRCGTRGVARFTHGIGNIRWTPGFAGYEGYRAYAGYSEGIADWFQLIRTLYVDGWDLRTVAQIVPRYAPAGDHNDVPSYIADVTSLVAGWRARAGAPEAPSSQ